MVTSSLSMAEPAESHVSKLRSSMIPINTKAARCVQTLKVSGRHGAAQRGQCIVMVREWMGSRPEMVHTIMQIEKASKCLGHGKVNAIAREYEAVRSSAAG